MSRIIQIKEDSELTFCGAEVKLNVLMEFSIRNLENEMLHHIKINKNWSQSLMLKICASIISQLKELKYFNYDF